MTEKPGGSGWGVAADDGSVLNLYKAGMCFVVVIVVLFTRT